MHDLPADRDRRLELAREIGMEAHDLDHIIKACTGRRENPVDRLEGAADAAGVAFLIGPFTGKAGDDART